MRCPDCNGILILWNEENPTNYECLDCQKEFLVEDIPLFKTTDSGALQVTPEAIDAIKGGSGC